MSLKRLLCRVRACTVCADGLPLGPRPVLQIASSARLLIVGQAPGRKVHETGVPWHDASGERLRDWMGIDRAAFYDEGRVAIVPIGLCYPGSDPAGGDKPPRPECAPLWHGSLIGHLGDVGLTLLVGQHAQRFHLRLAGKRTMTDTVRSFGEYAPQFLPLPHPSWRSTIWMSRNPWFEAIVLPELRRRVRTVLASKATPEGHAHGRARRRAS
ncbi:MAG: uracil-DNA glycosylase family protein [Rhodospirillales bacterium]|nr:uracil-DNA glycosylase family protein [Rhodospirillales bacterium]